MGEDVGLSGFFELLPLLAIAGLRIWLGAVFWAHGAQKIFGWFEGPGLMNWSSGVITRIGFRFPLNYARLAAFGELIGGPLLIVGLLTPLAAAWLSCVMIAAIARIHGKNGFWNPNRGFEYPASLLVALAAVGIGGPGVPSLDALLLDIDLLPLVYPVVLVVGVVVIRFGLRAGSFLAPKDAPKEPGSAATHDH